MPNNASQNLNADSLDTNRPSVPVKKQSDRHSLHHNHPVKKTGDKDQDGVLTAEQAKFVYWFNGLFPILTSIVTPLTVYRKVSRKPNASDIQRYNDLLQEVSRQLVSGTIGLVSYFSGGALTKAVLSALPSHHRDRDDRDASNAKAGNDHIKMIVGGSVLSFVGYSFLRPAIATDILYLLRKKEAHSGVGNAPKLSRWQHKLQDTVDRQLMQEGKPRLKKTALLSFVVLGAYLNALAFSIYGLSRAMNALSRSTQPPENLNSARQLRPTSSPMTPIAAPSAGTFPVAAMQTGGLQRPPSASLAYPRPGFAAYSSPLRTTNN